MSKELDIWTLNTEATRRGESMYRDPNTGFQVFSEFGLLKRGNCCGSGCRHCPYAHQSVPLHRRAVRAQQATWLTDPRAPNRPNLENESPADVLFWSGGKDSFLAYRALRREALEHQLLLLTTFDARTRRVAHQELDLEIVVRQAHALELPLIGVPLHTGRDYVEQVEAGLRLAPNLRRLVFGDLHLEHIRDWRERAFAGVVARGNLTLSFPLWQADYEELLNDLEASGVDCEISAVSDERLAKIQVGNRFDREWISQLPDGIDRFGEVGEFHTVVKFWS